MSLIDPSNTILQIKWPLGIAIIILVTLLVVIRKKSNLSILYMFSVIVIVIIALIVAGNTMVRANDYDVVKFQEFIASLLTFALLLWATKETNIDLSPFLFIGAFGVALITIVLFFLYSIDSYLYIIIYEYLYDKNTLLASERALTDSIGYMQIYYKTCATIVIPLAFYWHRFIEEKTLKNKFRFFLISLIYFMGLIFTGTRANFVLAISVILLVLCLTYVKKRRGQIAVAGVFLSCVVAVMLFLFSDFEEASNNTKLGHLVSYAELFFASPELLLLGEGAGTYFASQSSGVVTLTELTYFELVRVMGVPLFLVFLAYILLPYQFSRYNAQWAESKYYLVGYSAYLLIAGTNPLIIGSTGMIVIVSAITFTLQSGVNNSRINRNLHDLL